MYHEYVANLQIVEIQKGLSQTLVQHDFEDLQIVEIQKGLSRSKVVSIYIDLQIVEIQKGLSLFCFAKVQQIPDIECVFA